MFIVIFLFLVQWIEYCINAPGIASHFMLSQSLGRTRSLHKLGDTFSDCSTHIDLLILASWYVQGFGKFQDCQILSHLSRLN